MKDIPSRNNRLPALDGLRAISISVVLLGHASRTEGFPEVVRNLIKHFVIADLGVTIFFAISGFLITHLILQEYERLGRFSLKNFYVRRMLRIFPVYYAYILFVLILANYLPVLNVPNSAFVSAATYSTLLWGESSWPLAHSWSLCIEEQFYLIWPLVLVLGIQRLRIAFLIFCLMAFPVFRVLFYRFLDLDMFGLFVTQADPIFQGCLCAILANRGEKKWESLLQFWARYMIWPSIGLVFMVEWLHQSQSLNLFTIPFGRSIQSAGIALTIAALVGHKEHSLTRFLENRVLRRIGVLSYSLYIWQQFFMYPASYSIGLWTCQWPQNLILASCLAWISYEFLEKPILSLRKRFR